MKINVRVSATRLSWVIWNAANFNPYNSNPLKLRTIMVFKSYKLNLEIYKVKLKKHL